MALISAKDYLNGSTGGSLPGGKKGLVSAKDYLQQVENEGLAQREAMDKADSAYYQSQPQVDTPQTDPGAADSQARADFQSADQQYPINLPGGFLNPVNAINRLQRSKVGKFLNVFDRAIGHVTGVPDEMMAAPRSTGNAIADKVAEIGGGLAGFAFNPAQTEVSIGQTFFNNPLVTGAASKAGNVARNTLDNVLPYSGGTVLGKVAEKAAAGVVQGGLGAASYAPFQTLTNGGQLSDIPRNVIEQGLGGAAFGGALGGLGGAAGAGLEGIASKYAGTKIGDAIERFFNKGTPEPQPNILALPAAGETYGSRLPMLREGTAPSGDTIPMPGKIYEPPVLGLPEGNYTPPTRLKVADNNQTLDYVMRQIKPEVEQTIQAPARRDLLVNYLIQHLEVPRQEIHNMPIKDLQELGQLTEHGLRQRVPEIAFQAAQKRGYDLPGLLDGKSPTVAERGSQFAQQRAYGIYPESLPKLKEPNLNKQVLGEAAAPVQKMLRLKNPTEGKPAELPASTKLDPEIEKQLIGPETEAAKGTDQYNSFDPTKLKDISGFSAQTRDVYRNLEASLGKDNAKMFLEPFNDAKNEYVDMQKYWIDELKKNVVDKLGIQKGSKLSGLVQQYGEKKITLDELKQRAPQDWQNVVKADNWFRQSYDHLIDIVNDSRAKIYPNNPDKIVPKRSDYYRHFQELNGLTGLKNLFDTPSAIDPSLAGISEFTKPRSKFAGFMQRRGLGPFKNDAVGGFLNYIPSASYSTHIDPQIEVWRGLSKALADSTGESRNLNNLILYLNRFANDLADKTNPWDRMIQDTIPGGRKTMAAIQWLNNRVKANTILGNIGSTVAQTANIPNGIAFAKHYSVKGMGETLLSAVGKNTTPMAESPFLKERFSGEMYRQFDQKWIDQPKKFAGWMMETSDRIGTNFVWNSAYVKGVAEKVSDPVRYADDATRKLVAGRGVGEVPLLQKAKITQLLAPFQLEVANLWRVMGDFAKAKDFGAIATLLVANYLFNRAAEKVRGTPVTFDPIQAMIEASQKGLTPFERLGRVGGEVLSNLPLGQTAAQIYPEYGTSKLPTRKKLFGNNDPTRFGGGLLALKGLQDPLYKVALPFGGGQLKKTIQGIDALNTGEVKDTKGQLKYPVADNIPNDLRLPLFGPGSVPEAKQYYDNNRRPLGLPQTKAVEQSNDKQGLYNQFIKQREMDSIKSAILKVEKDKNLTPEQKMKQIRELTSKLQSAVGK